MEQIQFTSNRINEIKRVRVLHNNVKRDHSKNDYDLQSLNEIFSNIFTYIKDIFSNQETHHEDGFKINMISERKICIKVHYLDNYFIFLNSKNIIVMQKELNEEEQTEEYEKFNRPHKIGSVEESMNNIYKKIDEKIMFLLDLNQRGFVMKTYEFRINNFFKIIDKRISSSYLVFDEDPSFELEMPHGNIYFSLHYNNDDRPKTLNTFSLRKNFDNYYFEIDYPEEMMDTHLKILGNDKKIHFNSFGRISKGFQKISHYIMMKIFNTHIYQLGNKIIFELEKHFKNRFKKIDNDFTENLTPHFYKEFRIDGIQYLFSIEENGEVSIFRDSYVYDDLSDSLTPTIQYVEGLRLNKKLGFIQNRLKDVLIDIVKIILRKNDN